MADSLHLRSRRTLHARRHGGRPRLLVVGGAFGIVIGAACLAPLAPTALAPAVPIAPQVEQPAPSVPAVSMAAAPVPAPAVAPLPPITIAAAPTATPVPTPVVVPTITANGQNVLASIRSDRTAQWVKNHTETPLRSGPSDDASVFTQLPQWTLVKQIDSRPNWLLVQYSGDGQTREAGPGWVKASDVGGVDPPAVWLRSVGTGTLWTAWDASGSRVLDFPVGTLMEVFNTDIQGTRVHVRLPGDGRNVRPSEGWVDGDAIARAATPALRDLPRAYPDDLRADVRINVPYRTQLDGSDFASANCGPTVLGMALESFGMNLTPVDLRGQVLDTENFDPGDIDAGSYIWALAGVAQQHGLQPLGLYDADGSLHHWTVDDIRASVRTGQPVIVQVVYRGLPGREDSAYYGDHYIIITGLLGDQFLYNDPIGGPEAREAPGYDRVISPTQLQKAMRASDTKYAYTAFGLGKN